MNAADIGNALAGYAGRALDSGAVVISVKTNLGPEIPVTGGGGGGLADALGIRAAVIIRNKSGRQLAATGDPPATEPLRVALFVLVAGALGLLLLRGLVRR